MTNTCGAARSHGVLEQLVLLAALRLDGKGYAVTIRREIEVHTGRRVSRGAVYMTLERLETKRLLTSRLTDPTPERGGRAKRLYGVTPAAMAALRQSRRGLLRMWKKLETLLGDA